MRSRKVLSLGLAAVLGSVTTASALRAQDGGAQGNPNPSQPPRQDPPRQENREARRQVADQRMNRQITQWLLVDQEAIIDLAGFGVPRAKSPQVRQLAETLIRDHQAFAERLGRWSDQPASEADTSTTSDAAAAPPQDARQRLLRGRETAREEQRKEQRDAATQGDDGRPLEGLADRVERIAGRAERIVEGARDVAERTLGDRARPAVPSAGSPWVQIHRDITEKLRDVTRRDLENRRGEEFDAALVGMFIASHLQQEATLEVLRDRASGELVTTLDDALAMVKQHRQRAEQVMEAR